MKWEIRKVVQKEKTLATLDTSEKVFQEIKAYSRPDRKWAALKIHHERRSLR